MQITLRAFGQLTDIIKINVVTLRDGADLNALVQELQKLYPALVGKKYVIAVDKKTIAGNTGLTEGITVALLPPFSGG
ncbi:MAG: MoaD/ThiS family protein [Chitinophagaceae bacterium]